MQHRLLHHLEEVVGQRHGLEVALVVHVGEAEAARGDGDVLEPVEEVAVLGGAALEGDVGESPLGQVMFLA